MNSREENLETIMERIHKEVLAHNELTGRILGKLGIASAAPGVDDEKEIDTLHAKANAICRGLCITHNDLGVIADYLGAKEKKDERQGS